MSDVTVEIRDGKLRGASDGGVQAFKGVPYAAPPVGARRFLPPAPVEPWSGVRDALEYGPSCPQPSARPEGWAQEPSLSEDCLYLNVWTPASGDGGKRPVLVWLHGGGYSIGSGSWPVYDGAALARRGDAVIVTVNHRLNIFGYLHLAGLMPPEFASSSNAGMVDLVAALEWVRDNIATFGGDAGNVTIFGESGGGAKVSTLHAMPAARGLFHRAAIQSGPGLRARRPEAAADLSKQVLADLGVTGNAKALQALPWEQLLAAHVKLGPAGTFAFSPVLDGTHISEDPQDAYASGRAPDVPMIIGTNRDEASLFLARDRSLDDTFDEAALEKRMASLGDSARGIIDAYRAERPGASARELLVAIESDRMMRIPSIDLAERKTSGTSTPVFMYLFCWTAGSLGSAHGFEIPFVFDNARPPVMPESAGRGNLAAQMSEAWLAFARSGSPDHAGIPAWPAYSTDARATMIFDRAPAQVAHDPGAHERRAWKDAQAPIGMPA